MFGANAFGWGFFGDGYAGPSGGVTMHAVTLTASQAQTAGLTRVISAQRSHGVAGTTLLARTVATVRSAVVSASGGGTYGNGNYGEGPYGVGAGGSPAATLQYLLQRGFVTVQPQPASITSITGHMFDATTSSTATLKRSATAVRASAQSLLATRTAAVAKTAATDPVGQFARILTGQQQERFLTMTLTTTASLASHLRSVFRSSLPGRIVGAFRGFIR